MFQDPRNVMVYGGNTLSYTDQLLNDVNWAQGAFTRAYRAEHSGHKQSYMVYDCNCPDTDWTPMSIGADQGLSAESLQRNIVGEY